MVREIGTDGFATVALWKSCPNKFGPGILGAVSEGRLLQTDGYVLDIPPSPTVLESLAGRGSRKIGAQNLEG